MIKSRDNPLKPSYDSAHVYGAQSNYIMKKPSSFEVLPQKPKPSQFASSRRTAHYSISNRSNLPFSNHSASRYIPSPPRQSLTFKPHSDSDIVRPPSRDSSKPKRSIYSVTGNSQRRSTVSENYYKASSVQRPLPRDRTSPSRAFDNINDIGRHSRASPVLTQTVMSRPSRLSPISHRSITTKEEITIDNSPYSTGYQPSFSRSSSPKRVPDKPMQTSSSHDGNGTIGLKNIGNTCFMNSMLQCLSHTVQLRDYCIRSEYERELNSNSSMKGRLMKAFAEIIQELWSGRSGSVTPNNFKTQIQRYSPRFVGYDQQDSQEFLRFLLEGLHEDINQVKKKSSEPLKDLSRLRPPDIARETWKWYQKKDKSFVFDLFVGQLESYLQCVECGHVSLTYDPFWDLSLPISKSSYSSESISLDECLRTFTKEEILDHDEKPMCERCKTRRRMTKKLSIHRLPTILVIHLKRFHEGSRYRQKLSNLVLFPVNESLSLSQFISSTCEDKPSAVYDLYAVSNHCGSCYGGHYTAFCYNSDVGRWYEFNDSRVSHMNEHGVCTKEAYVLFYVQRSASKKGRSSRL